MPILTRNPKLKREVFKKIKKNEDLAMKEYKKGNLKKGKVYEKRADKLYADNYDKMFKRVY
jgi:hypothetical protein